MLWSRYFVESINLHRDIGRTHRKNNPSAAMLALHQASLSLNVVAPARAPAPVMAYSWSQQGVGATWDPLGLAKTPEKFEKLRYTEIKHGRVAMLAVLGHITAATGYRFPGELANGVKFDSVTGSGFQALGQCSAADYALILMSVAFLEIRVMKEQVKGEFPGDLRNGAHAYAAQLSARRLRPATTPSGAAAARARVRASVRL